MVEIGDRGLERPLGVVGTASIEDCFGKVALEPDGDVIVGNRWVIFFQRGIGCGAAIIGFRGIRLQLDGLGEFGDGLFVLIDVIVGEPASDMGVGVGRLELNGRGVIGDG